VSRPHRRKGQSAIAWLIAMACLAMLEACNREAPAGPEPAESSTARSETDAAHAAEHAQALYRCPMHPEIVRDAPGQCPICGMDLVRVSGGEAAASGDAATSSVTLSAGVVQKLGVRTAPATRGELRRELDTVGYVAFDERRIREVRTRSAGWVESLSVRATGETVKAGQPLFSVYSPTIAAAQQEYRDAQAIGNPELIEASRERLRSLGVAAGSGRTTYVAPVSGIVTELGVREGGQVTPEMAALTIVESDRLWVYADLPESLAALAGEGTRARLRFAYRPGEELEGVVDYVYPEVDPQTRTVRLRITLAPPPGLRPNMLAEVALAGAVLADVVQVPRSAVIRDGREERVIVALGEGRFAPRTIVTGLESGERIAVLEGLAAGEQVVIAGQFMIDSEASLSPALRRLGGEGSAPVDPHAGH
jgi:Cu(I)/Ag(I) efflux system membrane fusion protein